jgi:dTDP-4-dehydrorhamnose 3,5-epimerase
MVRVSDKGVFAFSIQHSVSGTMKTLRTALPGVLIVYANRFADDRGAFFETFKRAKLAEAGVDADFIQDNRSHSLRAFTVRGLHYQLPPYAQAKLVSVQWGRIFDVAVDLRRGSPTFKRHVAVELTADGGEQLFIPAGFAHGFCTLEDNTVVTYKVDNVYAPASERGLHWRAAELGIAWPCDAGQACLSTKDALLMEQVNYSDCFP